MAPDPGVPKTYESGTLVCCNEKMRSYFCFSVSWVPEDDAIELSGSSCLLAWVEHHLNLYLAVLERRLALETDEAEVLILVRYGHFSLYLAFWNGGCP
jgi:hypothetical protein